MSRYMAKKETMLTHDPFVDGKIFTLASARISVLIVSPKRADLKFFFSLFKTFTHSNDQSRL